MLLNLKFPIWEEASAVRCSYKWLVAMRFTLSFLCFVLSAFAQDAGITRLTVGVEQSASGAPSPVQKLSVRLFFTEPLGARISTWGDVRLSSLPQTISSTATSLPGDITKLSSTVPLNQFVRSGEFLAGAGYVVSGASGTRATVQTIASIGAAVPLESTPPPAVPQNRFLRQYYGGIRVLSKQHGHIVDVTLGQNEAITGGTLHGMVVRFDAYYALPLSSGNVVSLFGTAILKTSPRSSPGDTGSDSYRIGLAADLFQILKALRIN
jgi:hypothetical protein